jgi:hypothetical protein
MSPQRVTCGAAIHPLFDRVIVGERSAHALNETPGGSSGSSMRLSASVDGRAQPSSPSICPLKYTQPLLPIVLPRRNLVNVFRITFLAASALGRGMGGCMSTALEINIALWGMLICSGIEMAGRLQGGF